jgi:hypothetical protein
MVDIPCGPGKHLHEHHHQSLAHPVTPHSSVPQTPFTALTFDWWSHQRIDISEDSLMNVFLNMVVSGVERVVCPACNYDDASRCFVHALQEKEHKEEVRKVVDTKIRLEAIIGECLALEVLDSGVQDERTDWRKGAIGHTVIDAFAPARTEASVLRSREIISLLLCGPDALDTTFCRDVAVEGLRTAKSPV